MSTAIWSTRLATICSLSCRPELVPFTQGRRIAIRRGRAQHSNGTHALGSLQGAHQATGTFHSISQRWISSSSFNHRIKVLLNKKMVLIVTLNDTTGAGTHNSDSGIGNQAEGGHRRCIEHHLLVELEEQYQKSKVGFGYDASSQRQQLSLNKKFPVPCKKIIYWNSSLSR